MDRISSTFDHLRRAGRTALMPYLTMGYPQRESALALVPAIVEAGADLNVARIGVLHGTKSFVMQTPDGQIVETHSISAGLDYASVGPEHALLRDQERAGYTYATDDEALEAFQVLSQTEGIIPALESAHAVAEAIKRAPKMQPDEIIVVNLSGRGDKDLDTVINALGGDDTA